jgi:hypothetical protein
LVGLAAGVLLAVIADSSVSAPARSAEVMTLV